MKRFIITFAITLCGVIASAQDIYIGSWYKIEVHEDELVGAPAQDLYSFRNEDSEVVFITEPDKIGAITTIKMFTWGSLFKDSNKPVDVLVGYYNSEGELEHKETLKATIINEFWAELNVKAADNLIDNMFERDGFIRLVMERSWGYYDLLIPTFKTGPIYPYIGAD